MTLILSMLRPSYVVQVADRRLTYADGRVADDNSIKSVFFSNQLVFSFTGLAALNGIKTDIWLVNELSSLPTSSIEAAAEHIAIRATELFLKLRIPRSLKRLAFVATGFSDFPGAPPFPVFIQISNFHDPIGAELPQRH
jgi:hypothetical protein